MISKCTKSYLRIQQLLHLMFVITFLFIIKFWPVKYIYLTQLLTTFSSFAYSPRFSIFKKILGNFVVVVGWFC